MLACTVGDCREGQIPVSLLRGLWLIEDKGIGTGGIFIWCM